MSGISYVSVDFPRNVLDFPGLSWISWECLAFPRFVFSVLDLLWFSLTCFGFPCFVMVLIVLRALVLFSLLALLLAPLLCLSDCVCCLLSFVSEKCLHFAWRMFDVVFGRMYWLTVLTTPSEGEAS